MNIKESFAFALAKSILLWLNGPKIMVEEICLIPEYDQSNAPMSAGDL